MNKYDRFSEFEKKAGYSFKDKSLIKLAFTHSSYANEHKKEKHENNERLEFLGDAVLDMVVSQYIYVKFPELPEGELTKIRAGVVCEGSLASLARDLEFGRFLLLGKGEDSTGGRSRDSILADTFEAVIGAVCLDGGIDATYSYVLRIMERPINAIKATFKNLDCKTQLQEFIQKKSKLPVVYEIVDEAGPDHDKVFVSEAKHNGKLLGHGEGKSKKEAEQNAAADAIKKLEAAQQ